VLQHMNRDHPVKVPVRKIEAVLAIPNHRMDAREPQTYPLRHALAKFQGMIALLLRGRQALMPDVFPKARSNLKGRYKIGRRIANREPVVESFNESEAPGEDLVPEL